MRSSFKQFPISKQIINKIINKQLYFFNGWVPLIYLMSFSIEKTKNYVVMMHNGKELLSLNKIKTSKESLLDNFFFLKKLKIGNFCFRKKHCVFRSRKKK